MDSWTIVNFGMIIGLCILLNKVTVVFYVMLLILASNFIAIVLTC